jgi:hypothetical protein
MAIGEYGHWRICRVLQRNESRVLAPKLDMRLRILAESFSEMDKGDCRDFCRMRTIYI